ncbi:MAG: hypothetical protein JWM44_2541 [Bacilli bacterium]|nr:hypothetical protein [Bacilli bacterium]
MKRPLMLLVLFICTVMLLTACQMRSADNQIKTQSAPAEHAAHLKHPDVIPNQFGPKIRTTNEQGNTTYGLGTSVYSLIGSSSLHSNGFSSHLESRLSGEGVDGIKVFVFDDTVILATENRHATSSQLDPMQSKVLSPTGGQSARGPEPNTNVGTLGSGKIADDNLAQAEQRIRAIMGGDVRVLTATGAKAVQTIDRIRANTTSSGSSQAISNDLLSLLKMAK